MRGRPRDSRPGGATSGGSSRRRERRLLSLCHDGGARGITMRGRRANHAAAANHKGLFLELIMYTPPLAGSGELDDQRRHVVPRPQSQRTSDQLRAALGGRLALLQKIGDDAHGLLAIQHVPETIRS